MKVKTQYWRAKTDKLEHSDFSTQEQKMKVAIAMNDRLHAPFSAECISSLSGKNSVFSKMRNFQERKNDLLNFSGIVISVVNSHDS